MLPEISFLNFPSQPISCLGLGVFDGLHLGHKVLLDQCDALLSFNPHPDRVLQKSPSLKLLSTPPEMSHMTQKMCFLTFTKAIAEMSADDFLNEIILTHFSPKTLVVGFDFRFGYKQQGTCETLKSWGLLHGVEIRIIEAISDEEGPIKSERIRAALTAGAFEKALHLLGHPYWMEGTVIRGEGRGQLLGFPTANLHFPSEKQLPSLGVYGGSAWIDGVAYSAMIYCGRKPTFSGEVVGVEVHVLGYSGSLYEKCLPIALTRFIRAERKFKNKEDLIEQIKLDIASL